MKKNIVVVFVSCVIVFSSFAWLGVWYSNRKTPQPTTIVQQKSPIASSYNIDDLEFVGFQALIDHGLRENRLLVLKDYLKECVVSLDYKTSKATLDTGSVNYQSENNISFIVRFDKNQYSAAAAFSEGGILRLQMFDEKDKLTYDSGAAGNDLD